MVDDKQPQPQHDRDEPVMIDLEPEVALRALLKVDPDSEPGLGNGDAVLVRAWALGMSDEGWSDDVMAEAETLLPALAAAGYAEVSEDRWSLTPKGVKRAEELVPGD